MSMDLRKEMQKTYLNLIPPPPRSLQKLSDEEIKEVTDYIFEHAKQTHKLIKEDAERKLEEHKVFYKKLTLDFIAVVFILLLVIAYLTYKLNT